jgi:hypothetical protein
MRAGLARVKDFAHIDTAGHKLVSGSDDIRDDQVQALRRTGRAGVTFIPN